MLHFTRHLLRITPIVTAFLLLTRASAAAGATQNIGQNRPIWTIQDENASITTASPPDRYYVNGFHIGWTSARGAVAAPLAALGHLMWGGEGSQRMAVGLVQKIFTPDATQVTNPPTNDEPYAGYLAATVALIQDTAVTRSVLGASVGVVGPGAGAEIVQNTFHTIIGQKGTRGWAHQLPLEPAFDLMASRTWRFPVARLPSGLEIDALPQLGAMLGTTEINAEPAITFRLGKGLKSDFGAPLLRPGPSGSDSFDATRKLVWYVFGGVASKFVGHDEFLQGANFQVSRGVAPVRVVGQIEVGAAIIWRGLRFSYTQVFQTRRFYGQVGGIHEYGSFAISGQF